MLSHQLFGGELLLYKRAGSRCWQCSAWIAGTRRRQSTQQDSLELAKQVAEDWYLGLRGKERAGLLKDEKTFREAAEQFLREYPVIVQGKRNPEYIASYGMLLNAHVLPYFGAMPLSQITPGKVQEYKVHRIQTSRTGRPPARSTMAQDLVVIRQVLRTAHRHGWLAMVPDLSEPYRTVAKVGHRAWFSPQEYRKLYLATRRRAKHPPKEQWRWNCEQLHDYVLFMANTGLRPDEASWLEYRDVTIVKDQDTGEVILEIEVRGKRGLGHCKSTPQAVRPFRRLLERNTPQPTDRVFPVTHHELFNAILEEENLKFDRNGNRRTAYSLRHTYICLRLMERADIYQVAKNCRTSVEMIQKHYAVHLKHTIDAAALNRRRPRHLPSKRSGAPPRRRAKSAKPLGDHSPTSYT